MARADYIWTVVPNGGSSKMPVGGFTVRHELVSWLKRHPDPYHLEVWRCRDGTFFAGKPAVRIHMDDLIGPPEEPLVR